MRLIKNRIEKWLFRRLLFVVDANQVITANKQGQVFIGGKIINGHALSTLRSEAMFLKNTTLWVLFQETLRYQAQMMMFAQSNSFEDMRSGKMILHCLDTQKNICEIIEKAKFVDKKIDVV